MLPEKNSNVVKIWLWTGVVMVIVQLLLGAVTRLTESGLSITKWDLVSGILFPTGASEWNEKFELYKQTPQYSKINEGMGLNDFKVIFFWEYFHRLWARIIGFVFVIPLIYFLITKKINKVLLQDLGIVFLVGCLVASMGWIMVASGLTNRPWVNAYKLSLHLSMAVILLIILFWVSLKTAHTGNKIVWVKPYKSPIIVLILFIFIQIFLGGVMSGMKAGLVAPTWPDINGNFFPKEVMVLFRNNNLLFVEYEQSFLSSLLVQFCHRSIAYVIFIYTLGLVLFNFWKSKIKDFIQYRYLLFLIIIQGLLGIITVKNCIGSIPIGYGVMHQLFAILTILYAVYIFFVQHNHSEID